MVFIFPPPITPWPSECIFFNSTHSKDWNTSSAIQKRKENISDIEKTKMKCIQKLCQRTKTITSTGNLMSVMRLSNKILRSAKGLTSKTRSLKKFRLIWQLWYLPYKKLAHGQKVDPEIVSNLLLGGIINILAQHDTIASIEEKLKIVQHEINKQHKNWDFRKLGSQAG